MIATILSTLALAPLASPTYTVDQMPDPAIPALTEQSGLLKSLRYTGVYWAHNDSGDTARIFAFTIDGKPVGAPKDKPYEGLRIDGATNFDWEDISTDGDNLLISDLGNNANARRDLAIYVVPEPNPAVIKHSSILRRIPVAYDDQREFPPAGDYLWDCEAIFWKRGKMYAITKHRIGRALPGTSAGIYELRSQSTDRINTFRRIAAATGLPGWVTSASVSPDGTKLAVLCDRPQKAVLIADLNLPAAKWLSQPVAKIDLPTTWGQTESITWDSPTHLLVGHESGGK